MTLCLSCKTNKEELSFKKRRESRASAVCFACYKKYPIDIIINKVCVKNEKQCLLWPDEKRSEDYYNSIRKKIAKNNNQYVHVRCDNRCLNSSHFYYFKTNSVPYWFKYNLEGDINFLSPSEIEKVAIKEILLDKLTYKDECWVFGDASSKKANVRIGKHTFSSKKIYYEVFVERINSKYFSISPSCGNKNCVSPNHLELFLGRSQPFWAKKTLRKPDDGMSYCQNESCSHYAVQLPKISIKKNGGVSLCNVCHYNITSKLKNKKAAYDREYSEKNHDKIKKRIEAWSKTSSGKISQLTSSQNRRDKGLRKIDKSDISYLLETYNSCCYCGRPEEEISENTSKNSKLHIEHIIPILSKKQMGTNELSNLEIACWQCNSMKKNLSPKDWLNVISKRLRSCSNQDRVNLYNRIIENLSNEDFFQNDNFIPRHMRKQ